MEHEAFANGLCRCPYRLGVDVPAISSSKAARREGKSDTAESGLIDLLDSNQILEGKELVAVVRRCHYV